MLAALRFRRAQTVVVVVLAALVTACLVLAPLYTRALEQATVRTLLLDFGSVDDDRVRRAYLGL